MASTDADKPIDETLVDCCGITVMPKRDGMTVANFFLRQVIFSKTRPRQPRGKPPGTRTPRGPAGISCDPAGLDNSDADCNQWCWRGITTQHRTDAT